MEIKVLENRYHLDLDRLMVLGKRANNSKRNFLFISRVLGKHLEVEPNMCRVMGFLLASLRYGKTKQTGGLIDYLYNPFGYQDSVEGLLKDLYEPEESVAVLGFAETATGIGMAVASAIQNACYLHTTREAICSYDNFIYFQEEHSHATDHQCFPSNPLDFKSVDRFILVDDELTTGKSLLNMIEELMKVTTVRKFTMLTILDWRTSEHEAMVRLCEQKYGIEIEIQALIRGSFSGETTEIYVEEAVVEIKEEVDEILQLELLPRLMCSTPRGVVPYYRDSGRFGVSTAEILNLEKACQQLADKIQSLLPEQAKRILVLGHGEDIYIPSRIAAYLKGVVSFRSTSRSPILVESEVNKPIREKHCFKDEGVIYYLYHRSELETRYDYVVFITEKGLTTRFSSQQLTVYL